MYVLTYISTKLNLIISYTSRYIPTWNIILIKLLSCESTKIKFVCERKYKTIKLQHNLHNMNKYINKLATYNMLIAV